MADRKIRGRIVRLDRGRSSTNGNPSWVVTVEPEGGYPLQTYRTMSDTSWSYEANNPEYRHPALLEFTLTARDRIRYAQPVEKSKP